MKDGFSRRCRRSAGNGAYFSGELSYAVSWRAESRRHGDVLLCALLAHGNAAGVGAKADSHLIDAQGTVFVETMMGRAASRESPGILIRRARFRRDRANHAGRRSE